MKSPLSHAIALCFLLILPSTGRAQQSAPPIPRSNAVVAREIIEITGTAQLSMQVMNQMIPALKQAVPDLQDDFWTAFVAEVKPDELVDLLIPIYCQHFSAEELEQLLAFYKTPVGQKLIKEMPEIMQKSMTAGEQWGRQIGELAFKKAEAQRTKPSTKF